MNMQSLNGQWQLHNTKDNTWIKAFVPGCVELDLMHAGLIPDPFVGPNEEKVQWIFDEDWEYQLTFSVDDNLIAHEKVILRCEGIDTVAEIILNGELIGSTDNMFRIYEFDVTNSIRSDNNTLSLRFPSLSKHLAAQYERRFIDDTSKMGIEGGHYMRKAPCHFGWDWGPKLPPIGIWKNIELVGRSEAQFDDIHLRQIHQQDGSVQLIADIAVELWSANDLKLTMSITNPDGQTFQIDHNITDQSQIAHTIANPQLWYPAGYGDQPLYQITFQLQSGQTSLDTRQYQVGLRTIELQQEDDEWGKSFTFVVNGIPVFAKGSNWIPADSFPTRITNERLERWIADAVAANHNMLRVWGGGIYETEDFYDLCDKYGVLVWQDFTFACKIYPMDEEEYLKNVQQEVNDNVKRIRHRASLALWCGNNEMEWGWEAWVWDTDENATLKSGYDIFFHHLLPKWLQDLDPDTPYWPSSPSSNTPFKQSNSNNSGDAHYWSVWHGGQPFTAYREQYPRFMSEFGFQAFPPMETINFYASQEEQNLTSYVMELHQKNKSGNRLIINQMTDNYRIPSSFSKLMYASQVLQAEGIRYGVEHWRRNKHRTSGILYWQLNDCWPVASWSSIDYFGRWKALHYAAKKFYAPVLLSLYDHDDVVEIYLTSDLQHEWQGEVCWQITTTTGAVKDKGVFPASIAADQSMLLEAKKITLSEDERFNTVFITELFEGERLISTQIVTFVPNKHLRLINPDLSHDITIDGVELTIHISAVNLARFVEVKLTGVDTVFSDNFFDIPSNESRTITCQLPIPLSKQEIEKKLTITHLYDSYQG